MGGATLMFTGKSLDEVLEKLRSEIRSAIEEYRLFPDSDVAVLAPDGTAKIFRVDILWRWKGENPEVVEVEFHEVDAGNVAMPLAVASLFGPKPKPGEWLATVHVHGLGMFRYLDSLLPS